ncbi:AT-rich interactive domain-containing protein 5 isoform X2 [Lotus japonicus]|uniref:ARID/BRIGHT DNA binding domain containing protein n=1 Tax=Lotus japonicus TaxID=34305 RepID=B2CZF7_LOTJA|nr:AT-rich interactive domain-containing protein 5 isoform X2 [Lotus japonicus]ACB59277.1 ARID/BRIGHT DNA binding domain containing protein [Lotus japonicus]
MEGGEKPVDNMEIVDDDTTLLPQNSDKDQNAGSSPMVLAPNSLAQIPKDEVMVDQGDDDNRIGDSTPNNMLEVKTGSENQLELEDVKTPLHQELVTPKSRERNVREMKSVLNDTEVVDYDEPGASLEREAFMKELENFYRERSLEFKPPKFYGEPLNCLKLWRAVIRLGGYDVVTGSKLWRQVGESFHPPKTCTTVSWTFRIFYEKALLEYEKHKREIGELQLPVGVFPQPSSVEKETTVYQAPGSGRARRDAAARAMQGWHAQRLLGYGEVAEPVIKDKNFNPTTKREKNLKSIGAINKQRTPSVLEHVEKAANIDGDRQLVTAVVDVGPPADWVKINVRETVRVQSDPVGRLVITGMPEHIDNPWGITPFKKVVNLPARIDPLQTSAVVSLHGRLFVRVPFEQGAV